MNFTGKLLISSPMMVDPNFAETVILVIQHTDKGTIGVTLNRTSSESLENVWKQIWNVHIDESKYEADKFLCLGGPVFGALISVHDREDSGDPVAPGIYYAYDPDKVLNAIDGNSRYRIYQGYAGWTGGQLESEIARGAWMVADADPEIVFYNQHEDRDLYKVALHKFGRNVYRSAGIDVDNSDHSLN